MLSIAWIDDFHLVSVLSIDLGDNILTALSVARDCDMIPDDAKIISIEATDPSTAPIFTYAQVFNRRVKEVRYDLNVRTRKNKHDQHHL